MTWDDDEVVAHRAAVSAAYAVFYRTPRHWLRSVTVVHGAYVVRLDDNMAPVIGGDAAQIARDWRETLMRGGRIRRDPRGYTRLVGGVEIDLLHPRMLCSRMKSELLSGFGIDFEALREEDRVVVLHTHVLIDGRGHTSWAALARDLRARWPGLRQVYVADIRTVGSTAENIDRLAGYVTKFKLLYSKGWLERKTYYTRQSYGESWCKYIKNLYRAIGFDNLLISTVKSRASGSRVYSKNADCLVENHDSGNLQLESQDIRVGITKDNMRIKEILPYIDLKKIETKTLLDLYATLERMDAPPSTEERLMAQYGDEAGDIEIEQARMDLEQTRAEIVKLRVEASKEIAAEM